MINQDNQLRNKILQELRTNLNVRSVPELAALTEQKVTPYLLKLLFELKEEKLITWRLGKFIHLRNEGYKELEALEEAIA